MLCDRDRRPSQRLPKRLYLDSELALYASQKEGVEH